jgi:N-acetyl-alpha-D-muramate 1-phosphate uridylyltransferase
MRPTSIMLFAAGFGSRMGEMTQTQPKPLLKVGDRCLIDHALALAKGAGLDNIVVNLHYLGAQIQAHLATSGIQFSWETPAILETGGGLKQARPMLGDQPVFTLNTDAVWGNQNPLLALADHWDPEEMDALLLLVPVTKAIGHRGTGDFVMDKTGRIARAHGATGFVYVGAQIIKTEPLEEIHEQSFSLNLLWDRFIAKGRLYGVLYDQFWCDVGTPQGIALAEETLKAAQDV